MPIGYADGVCSPRHRRITLAAGISLGIVWMVAQALMPFALGRAVEHGLAEDDTRSLWLWAGAAVLAVPVLRTRR